MRSYHEAVQFYGNDHIIEENEFAHVTTIAYETGALYGGKDLSARGTVISHNLFRNTDRPSVLLPWTAPTRAGICASTLCTLYTLYTATRAALLSNDFP